MTINLLKINFNKFSWLVALAATFILPSCGGGEFTPKPKGYNRIDLPKPEYQAFDTAFPYRFEYSKHSRIRIDSGRLAEPFWIDIRYPQFDANVQITYKPLGNDQKKLNSLVEDTRKLVSKHQVKAYSIEEYQQKTKSGNIAYSFVLSGQVPSQYQFYTTDSANHFFRGALYFKTATQNDSLAPIIDFISKDMQYLLSTFEWKTLPPHK